MAKIFTAHQTSMCSPVFHRLFAVRHCGYFWPIVCKILSHRGQIRERERETLDLSVSLLRWPGHCLALSHLCRSKPPGSLSHCSEDGKSPDLHHNSPGQETTLLCKVTETFGFLFLCQCKLPCSACAIMIKFPDLKPTHSACIGSSE